MSKKWPILDRNCNAINDECETMQRVQNTFQSILIVIKSKFKKSYLCLYSVLKHIFLKYIYFTNKSVV